MMESTRPVGSRRSSALLVLERGVILLATTATENAVVAKELLEDLVAQGSQPDQTNQFLLLLL